MKKTALIISGAFIIIVTTILVKMFTLETEVELVQTIKLPELPKISEFAPGDYRQIATSVDGKTLNAIGDAPVPTASTAKMILALAIMEKKPFSSGETGESVTITPEFYQKYLWYRTHNGSTTAVALGEIISQYDALASTLLASSNNMADSLAIWAFGSLEEYQEYATKMLEKMGLKNTHIGTDASGYSESTTSTAEDLAIIARELLKNPVLKAIVGLKTHAVPVAGELKNTNQILGEILGQNTKVIGVKTGYIGDISGYNLVSAYEMEGHFITLALLGASTREASFEESKNTLLKLSEELTPTTIVEKDQTVGYLETWWSGRHDVKAEDTLTVLAPASAEDALKLEAKSLSATISGKKHDISTYHAAFPESPSFFERFLRVFGWSKN